MTWEAVHDFLKTDGIEGVALIDGRSRPYFRGIEKVLNAQQREALAQGIWQVLETIPDSFDAFEFQFVGTQVYIYKLATAMILLVLAKDELVYPDYSEVIQRLRHAFEADGPQTVEIFRRSLSQQQLSGSSLRFVSLPGGQTDTERQKSHESASVEPASVEPASVEPASVEPASVEPASPEVLSSVESASEPLSLNGYGATPPLATPLIPASDPSPVHRPSLSPQTTLQPDEAQPDPQLTPLSPTAPSPTAPSHSIAFVHPESRPEGVGVPQSPRVVSGSIASPFQVSEPTEVEVSGSEAGPPSQPDGQPASQLDGLAEPDSLSDQAIVALFDNLEVDPFEVDDGGAIAILPTDSPNVLADTSASLSADASAGLTPPLFSPAAQPSPSQTTPAPQSTPAPVTAPVIAPVTADAPSHQPSEVQTQPTQAPPEHSLEPERTQSNIPFLAPPDPILAEPSAPPLSPALRSPETPMDSGLPAFLANPRVTPGLAQTPVHPLHPPLHPGDPSELGNANRPHATEPIGEPRPDPSPAETLPLEDWLQLLNQLSEFATHYLGRAVIVNYWKTCRPPQDWLKQFEIERSGRISLQDASLAAAWSSQHQTDLQDWVAAFLARCTQVLRDFPKLASQKVLTPEQCRLLGL